VSEPPEPIVRAIDAFNRRDVEAMRPYMRKDVVWVEDPRYPGAETYHGYEGVARSLAKWFDTWAELRTETVETIGAGDTWLLTSRVEGRGEGSEVPVTADSFSVYELRDGLVARVRLFGDRDEALAAAGLSQES
jgi:ketosteroid isomerase-like protein